MKKNIAVCLGVLSRGFLFFYSFFCLFVGFLFSFFFSFFVVIFFFNYYESKKSKNWRTIPNNVVN